MLITFKRRTSSHLRKHVNPIHIRQTVLQAISPDFGDRDMIAFFKMDMVKGLALFTGLLASLRLRPFMNILATNASQGLGNPRRRW